jgi:hypothetical protein
MPEPQAWAWGYGVLAFKNPSAHLEICAVSASLPQQPLKCLPLPGSQGNLPTPPTLAFLHRKHPNIQAHSQKAITLLVPFVGFASRETDEVILIKALIALGGNDGEHQLCRGEWPAVTQEHNGQVRLP